MKILIHTDEYYPTCAACAYRMKVFADIFVSKGNEVTVIASSTNKGNGTIENCGEKIIFAPTVKMKKKTAVMRMINNLCFAVTSVFAALGTGRTDVVITTSPPPLVSISGWLIAKIKRAKLIYDVRDIWPDVAIEMNSFSENSLYCKVFKRITGFMYKHADLITTVSPGKVRKIQNKLPEAAQNKAVLVSNGFDENILISNRDESIIDQYKLKEGFTCVYIGNIGLAQGLDILLEIAEKTVHRNARFLLFGTGAEKDLLEQRAKERHLHNVSFCGVIPHDKVFTLLSQASMSFISLKSAKMKDSIPTKVYEALGVGCPVFLVAEGDSCDVVNEVGLGRYVSPENPKDAVSEFDRFVDDYCEITKNRCKSSELMQKKYSRQQIAYAFEEQLAKLIS